MNRRDVFNAAGLVLLAVGCGLAYPPLGLIIPGVLLLAMGQWGTFD